MSKNHPILTEPCVVCRKPCCIVENCNATPECQNSTELHLNSWVCSKRCWELIAILNDVKIVIEDATPKPSESFKEIVLNNINTWIWEGEHQK